MNLEESAGVTVTAWDWLAKKLPILNQFVTNPIAWLTLSTVGFGTSIAAKKASETAAEPKGEAGEKPAQSSGSTSIRYRMRSTARQEAKTAVDNALQPVADPIKTTWEA